MKNLLVVLMVLLCSNLFAEQIPLELAYPPYSQQADKITMSNLKKEFQSRRWAHMMIERGNNRCWKIQKRILKAIEGMKNAGLTVPEITDDFVTNSNSILEKYKKLPTDKAFPLCSFASYGNLNDKTGVIYCKYHGIDDDFHSSFAKSHKSEFMKVRPFINIADVVDLIYFFSSFLIFAISTFIMKKLL